MQVINLPAAHAADDPLRAHLGRLIAVVGTPKFESELLQVAHEAFDCEHVTAFVDSEETGPRVALAANVGSANVARTLADRYIARYWNLDPATREKTLRLKGGSLAVRIAPDDIDDSFYRHDCYTAVNIVDRFTLMQRRGQDIYRLSFYTARRRGRLDSSEINALLNSGDLLMSLVMKNDAAGPSDALTPQLFTNRLRLVAPDMPRREQEVCTGIMLGLTSEAIALKLGISVNTVLTYRKRAYSRLNISCQNELMRLVLA